MGIVVSRAFADLPSTLAEALSNRRGMAFFRSREWYVSLLDGGVFEPQELRLFHDTAGTWLLATRLDPDQGICALANYYTLDFGFSGEPQRQELPALARALMNQAGVAGRLTFSGLCMNQADASRLREAMNAAGYLTDIRPRYGHWYSSIRCEASTYLRERPARLRTTLERGDRRLRRDHGCGICVVTSPGRKLEEGIRAYEAVYARSWKPAENFPRFVPALIRTCAELGVLRLGILYARDIPVAAQLWICDRHAAYIYKLAHDPEFDRYSVGSLLTARLMERAIDQDQVRLIDFGMGDEPYKQDWVNQRSTIAELSTYNPWRIRGAMGGARLAGRRLTRRLVEMTGLRRDS